MSKIELSGTIGSLLSFYKHERNIFGRCPHCDEPFRLSEIKLTYGKEPPRDLLSRMKKDRDKLQGELEALEAEIEEIEDQHGYELEAVETKWKDRVDIEVEKATKKREKEIRQKAIAQSRAGQLGKTLEKVVPMFPGFGHHPYDVRPVFDPIDFVIFDGYYQGKVTDVCFVEFKTGQSRITPVQNSIRAAIENKRVYFEEKRLNKDAVKMLTEGKPPQARQLIKRTMT
jgi:predicted Holliday junction resolvase-like endonuclease